MRPRLLPCACACALAAALLPASAQQQTAAGAQQFLGMLAGDGALFVQALDKTTNAMTVQGTQTFVRRWLKNGVPQNDGPYGGVSTSPTAFNLSQMLDVKKAEGLDPQANVDPCTTRLETSTKEKPDREHVSDASAVKETFFGYDTLPYRETVTTRFEDPNVKYAGPYYVAWGKAVISRSTGWIAASTQDSRFNAHLFFKIKDQEMADRVEYAMKFLKASCDKTTATGF
ncbi:hypothetical protein [Roseateles sp. LYH14W]|uniref:Uncharacterized protein n=1 Tax=Pelomonas parva TaxID=3299032 RepID=A0ABW7F0C8_9BURK